MKKTILVFTLIAVSVGMYAKTFEPGKVDPRIENKFRNEHGPLVEVSWRAVEDVLVATYSENGERKQAYYNSDGDVMALGRFISTSQLPTAVTQSITRLSPTNVLTAYELKTPDASTRYLVRIVNPKHIILVSADEFGNLEVLEKIRNKSGS